MEWRGSWWWWSRWWWGRSVVSLSASPAGVFQKDLRYERMGVTVNVHSDLAAVQFVTAASGREITAQVLSSPFAPDVRFYYFYSYFSKIFL